MRGKKYKLYFILTRMAKNNFLKILDKISTGLLVMGGLILGVIGVSNFNFSFLNPVPLLLTSLYSLIGLSAIWTIFRKIK